MPCCHGSNQNHPLGVESKSPTPEGVYLDFLPIALQG
jgi:hypothetical protein